MTVITFNLKNTTTPKPLDVFSYSWKKNTTETDLDYSKKWTTSGKLKVIQAPLNPGQFDYKHYLKTIGIYHQFEIDSFPTAVKNQKANFFLQSKAYAINRLKKSIRLKLYW